MIINALIPSISDYQKPEILFRDVTTLIKNSADFNLVISEFCINILDCKLIRRLEFRCMVLFSEPQLLMNLDLDLDL